MSEVARFSGLAKKDGILAMGPFRISPWMSDLRRAHVANRPETPNLPILRRQGIKLRGTRRLAPDVLVGYTADVIDQFPLLLRTRR